MGSRPELENKTQNEAPDLNVARFSWPSWQDFLWFFRRFFRLCERSERASAASEASGATSRQTQHEAAGILEKIKQVYVEWFFGTQKEFREVLNITSGSRSILICLGTVLELKLSPKLDPSCLQNGPKSACFRFFGGSDVYFISWWVFIAKKSDFKWNFRSLGP